MAPNPILFHAVFSDLPSAHHFQLTSDATGPIGRLAFPHGTSERLVAHYVARSRQCMCDVKSTLRRAVTRDDEGAVIGWALWSFIREKQIGMSREVDAGGMSEGDGWPDEVNREVLEAWIRAKGRKREEAMGGRAHAYLASLLPFPSSSSHLLEWGLSLADAHQLPTYVEAPPEQLPLFFAHGFKEIDTTTSPLVFDLRPWTGGLNGHSDGTSTPGRIIYHHILVRPVPSLPWQPDDDAIVISPWLTNADFVSAPMIEDAALYGLDASHEMETAEPNRVTVKSTIGTTTTTITDSDRNGDKHSNYHIPPPSPFPSPLPLSLPSPPSIIPPLLLAPDPTISSATLSILRTTDQITYLATSPTAHAIKAFTITHPPSSSQKVLAWAHYHIYIPPFLFSPHTFPPIRSSISNPTTSTTISDETTYFHTLLHTQATHFSFPSFPSSPTPIPYIFTRLLVVHPQHQRRGIGTRLLHWGTEIADGAGLKTWIDAGDQGVGLYVKLGWREVGRLRMEMEGKITISMVRDPRMDME